MPYMIRRRIMWPGETYVLKYVDVFVLFFEITETKNEVYGVPSSLQLKTCSSRDMASAIPSSWSWLVRSLHHGCPTPLSAGRIFYVVLLFMSLDESLNFGG